MTKSDFLSALREKLTSLSAPMEEISRSVTYYREMIDDKIEEGLSEEEAVLSLGDPEEIALEICRGMSDQEGIIRKKVSALPLVLIILGSPLWLPLLAAAAILIFSAFIVLWAAVIVIAAAELSLVVSSAAGIVGGVWYAFTESLLSGVFTVGVGFICGGLFLILLRPVLWLMRQISKASVKMVRWFVGLFRRKGTKV